MPIVVSESKAEETLQAYAHPLSIQAKAINELENRLLDGDVVADGNNVFTFLTEFSANMTAGLVQKACACFNSLYPENAQTATDLYKHLSDFDYIGLFATPAEMTVELVFDRNFLIDNAVYDSSLKCFKIIVPEYSKFTVGTYVFGLMYPIEIRIRKAPSLPNGQTDYDNSVITVMWDTSRQNPLKSLESHILEHREFVQESQTLTAIEVPIYQFEVENHVENAIASTGFAKRYDYQNKFYAVRVFHFKGGQWNEMAQTLSDINYDVDKPTAMVKVLADIGKVEIVIPQIYFDTEKESASLGNRILVKVYNTQGELNLDVSSYDVNQYSASFLLTDTILIEDDTYSNMLKRIPTIYILPASKRIASGTDGITMDALKERVKHDASYTVKITPDDLDAYFATSGFTFTKELDNITDRVYCAHKVLTDGTGTTIAAGEEKTYLTPETINIQQDSTTSELYVPNYSSISVLDTNTITICPTAVYRYNEEENYFEMMSDDELSVLNNTTAEDRIALLNSGLYTFNPFHIRVSLDPSLPIAGSYDLANPSLKSIIFNWENPNTTVEISVYTADIKVLNTTDQGYRLSVALFKTANISDIPAKEQDGVDINNIHVMLSTTNSTGVYLYMLGQYDGKDDSDHDVFIFDIKSTFKLTNDNMFDVTNMFDASGDTSSNFLDMDTHAYQLSFFIKEEFVTDSDYPMEGVPLDGVPGSLDGYVYLCQQEFKLKFGEALPLLKNNLAIGASSYKYATYPTTQFDTYRAPIYSRWTVQDVKNKVIDPVTDYPVVTSKIGMLRLDTTVTFNATTDTVFKEGKTYYKYDSENEEYIKVEVTPGTAITGTYYERKVTGYYPVVKHAQGDVIISSPYGFNYGPVMTLSPTTESSDVTSNSLQLIQPYTVTSATTNVWKSIAGDILITGCTTGSFNGLYNGVASSETDVKKKVWKLQSTALNECFDISTLLVGKGNTITQTLYKQGEMYYLEPPEGKSTAVTFKLSGSYLSSNSDTVKADPYVASCSNTRVNTKARGTNRKWYLIVDSASEHSNESNEPEYKSFDFENNTGFIIEYSATDTSDVGVDKSWNLSYCFMTTDESGLPCTNICTIATYLDTTTSIYLSDTDREKLNNDAYIAQYDNVLHVIKFLSDSIGTGWRLGITNDLTNTKAIDYRYKAEVADIYLLAEGTFKANTKYFKRVGEEYGELIEGVDYTVGDPIPAGEYYTLKVLMPYEAEWVNLSASDKSKLIVTCINSNSDDYQVTIKEALKYIIDYINSNPATLLKSDALDLSKFIDSAKVTTDTVFDPDTKYYIRSSSTSAIRRYTYTEMACTLVGTSLGTTVYYECTDDAAMTFVRSTDSKVVAKKIYYLYNSTTKKYEVAIITNGATIPKVSAQFYNKCDDYLVDPLDGYLFACAETCADTQVQESCNAEINCNMGVRDETYNNRYAAVGTDDALGAVYYKDTDYINYDYTKYGLTVKTIVSVLEAWDRYKVYTEDMRYKYVVAETGVAIGLVKELVSTSKPCFITPWRKMVTVSSFKSLEKYYNERRIVNCSVAELADIQALITAGYDSFDTLKTFKDDLTDTNANANISSIVFVKDISELDEVDSYGNPTAKALELQLWLGVASVAEFANLSLLGSVVSPTCCFVTWKRDAYNNKYVDNVVYCGYDETSCKNRIMSYSIYSGFMYVVGKKTGDAYIDTYINYTSKVDRTYTTDISTYTKNEFNINFETTIWSEIDKWPWEIESPWLQISSGTSATIADIEFKYNTDISCAKILHANTDVLIDSDGNPIVATDGSRSETFMLDMLHCDYKLMLSEDTDYDDYTTDIQELLRSYFNELVTISPSLLARTKIYFAPIRTFGTAAFKADGGKEVSLPLEFSVGLGLHVESYVNGNDLNKDTIRQSILSLIDTRLKEGYLNLALLARDITDTLSDNVICVDVLGINGDNSLQTMIPVNADTYPQLKQVLEMHDDGSIHTTRRLDITWYVVD